MVKRSKDRIKLRLSAVAFRTLLALVSVAVVANDQDPFEPVNRVVFTVNDGLDTWLLKPTAKVYQAVMPEFAERGVRNFFSNLGEIRNLVHNTLQGDLGGGAQSVGRFAINSTVGIGGLFDVASKIGIDQKTEDLGQTLGVWGVNSGPYLVLPLLGPSSLRDGPGVIIDPLLSPTNHMNLDIAPRIGLFALDSTQLRADLLAAESLVIGDAYTLYRQAYLSKREYDVNNGQILTDDFLDADPIDDWDEDEFVDEEF